MDLPLEGFTWDRSQHIPFSYRSFGVLFLGELGWFYLSGMLWMGTLGWRSGGLSGCGICRAGKSFPLERETDPTTPPCQCMPQCFPAKASCSPSVQPSWTASAIPVQPQHSPTVTQSGLATARLYRSQYNPFYRTLIPV